MDQNNVFPRHHLDVVLTLEEFETSLKNLIFDVYVIVIVDFILFFCFCCSPSQKILTFTKCLVSKQIQFGIKISNLLNLMFLLLTTLLILT